MTMPPHTLTMADIVNRQIPPDAWSEGDKIPWNNPEFSRRMLNEHLSQSHNAASRQSRIIEQQVAWIHETLLTAGPANVLDMGCGPGFYTRRLAERGHRTTGIDYSPASIAYARQNDPVTTYIEGDLRTVDFGADYDLVMMVYGEINTFHPGQAWDLLVKARQALKPGGTLLLEAHRFDAVYAAGNRPPNWFHADWGLFSDAAHIGLYESFWDVMQAVATERYYIIEAASGAVARYISTTQAYTDARYDELLTGVGFEAVTRGDSLTGDPDDTGDFLVLTAKRPAEDGEPA